MIIYCIVTAFLNVLASVILGLSVLFKDPKRRENHLFAWFTASFAAWSFFYVLWQLVGNEKTALNYARLLTGASIYIPITYFHFVSRLAGKSERVEIVLGYVAALALSFCTLTPYLVRSVEPAMMFRYWPKGGVLFYPYIITFAYFTVRAWARLIVAYREAVYWRKKQLGYVCACTVVGWAGGLTNFLLWFDIPVPPVGNGLALVYIIGVSYAMMRFRLVDMDLVLIKAAAYLFFVAAVAALFPLLTSGLAALVPAGMPELERATLYVGAFLVTLALVWVYPHFRRRLENVLEDRAFGADRRELSEHIRRISLIADPVQLYRETVEVVSHGLEVPRVAIYCRTEHASHYQLCASLGFPDGWIKRGALGEKDWIIRKAQASGTVTVMYELEQEREGDDWREMEILRRESGIEVVVPIKADSIFYGVLVCGSRKNHRLYPDLAVSLLETIGLQIGLTLRSRQIERQANQTEKLISLGTLAAGLAHELRNPLVSIRTFGALIEEQGGDAEFRREFRGVVERDVNRIGSIIDHVAAFAENSQVKFSAVQLTEVISGVHDIARMEFTRSKVNLVVKTANMPSVLANYGQLIQVFLNLFQNAIQAMEEQLDSRIDVSFQLVEPEHGKRAVLVTISDNGPGIDESVRERIFDPFVTTKATGETGKRRGMGLGLAIVKRIIDGHGGTIDVASQPGRGTSFFVQLPCVEFPK